MNRLRRFFHLVCENSYRRPWIFLGVTILLSIPALSEVRKINLDTDLTRLLPKHSAAAQWTLALRGAVGDGGYFAVLLEGSDRERLLQAVHYVEGQARKMERVHSVDYRHPTDFFKKYRYLLIPVSDLKRIYERVIHWQAEVNPIILDFLGEAEKTYGSEEERKDVDRQLNHYGNLPEYHQNGDGTILGLFIRPKNGATNLKETRELFFQLESLSREVARTYGVWAGVGGSLRNKINEFDLIVSDIKRAGFITTLAILLVLVWSFRSVTILPVLVSPMAIGLLWAYALIPAVVGGLNTITSFLLQVLFGMGIDYSIHFIKRFQQELVTKPVVEALKETYGSTGISVLISGATTAFALFILAFSNFRGFSEFGLIGGGAMTMILLVMFTVFPSVMVLGHRFGLLKARETMLRKSLLTPKTIAVLGSLLVIAAVVLLPRLRFDYDFSQLKATVPESEEVKKRQREVYTTSLSPAALYVAHDLERLDSLLEILENQRESFPESKIGRITSVRDFAPSGPDMQERLKWISRIQEKMRENWIDRVKDPEIKRWIQDLRAWRPPPLPPGLSDVPPSIRRGLQTRDESNRFLVGLFPSIERKQGQEAMLVTEELYGLRLPAGIEGPVGETPIFAEILWLVTFEGPWLTFWTFLMIYLLVWMSRPSIKETFVTLLPLSMGFVLTVGMMVAMGLKLNFFNIVVFPVLVGMGEDFGVHYYRRWKELNRNDDETSRELFEPLTVCAIATLLGYAGLAFAHHEGLKSIGLLACLGLACVWFTSLIVFPGILYWPRRKRLRKFDRENQDVGKDS